MRKLIALLVFISCVFSVYAQSDKDLLIPFKNGENKWGYANLKKEIVIKCQYDESKLFDGKFGKIRKGDLWGVIDRNGKEVLGLEYDAINKIEDSFIVASKNGMIGVISNDNRVIVPFKFKEVEAKNGFFIVTDSLSGMYDRKGRLIIPKIYQRVNSPIKNLIVARLNKKSGVINLNHKTILPFEFDFCSIDNLIKVGKGGAIGAYSLDGKPVIPIRFSKIDAVPIANGLTKVSVSKELYSCTREDSIFIYNSKGKLCIPFSIDREPYIKDSLMEVSKNNKSGVYSISGKQIIPVKYLYVNILDNSDLIEVHLDNRKAGLISKKSKIIAAPQYDYIYRSSDTLYSLRQNNKWTLVNNKGKVIIPSLYSKVECDMGRCIGALEERQYSIRNITSSEVQISPTKYFSMEFFGRGLLRVSRLENQTLSFGVIRLKDEAIAFPFKYSRIERLTQNGYYIGSAKFRGYALLDSNGNNLTDFIYDEIKPFSRERLSNYLLVEKNSKWGIITLQGKEITPCKYGSIEEDYFFPLKVKNKLDDKEGYIDSLGKEILPPIYFKADFIRYKSPFNYFIIEKEIDEKDMVPEDTNGTISGYWDKIIRRGVVDGNGNTVITPGHYYINFLNGVFALTNGNRKTALYSQNGQALTPYVYQEVDPIYFIDPTIDNNLLIAKIKENEKIKYLLMDNKGKVVNNSSYTIIGDSDFQSHPWMSVNGKNIIVSENDKYGLLDKKGQEIISCTYDYIKYSKEMKFYLLTKDGHVSYMSNEGIKFFE